MSTTAILVLEDGSIFKGKSIGVAGVTSGEVVFNTAITGYQEILTDPSYAEQIVTLTYPHIGNTGINQEDDESGHVWAKGLVIRDASLMASNWRKKKTLTEFLEERSVVAIADIDTRRLTRILRDKGAQRGTIWAGADAAQHVDEALALAKSFPGLKGMDLAQVVTTPERYNWTEGSWELGKGHVTPKESPKFHVVAYDFGIKRNILRLLIDRGCRLTVVPAKTSADEVLALSPDGIFLSNGPGDPEPCEYAIAAIRTLLKGDLPIFGICLGHQLLALASGAKTVKMKFGHHGANHPVTKLGGHTVMITSQNHGFAVAEDAMPAHLQVTHRSLFDGSVQGVSRIDKPAFGFQGHPEASPGPHDSQALFDQFIQLMQARA